MSDPAPICITMGDPCGIGPEIVAMMFADPNARRNAFVIGDVGAMVRGVAAARLQLSLAEISGPETFDPNSSALQIVQAGPQLDLPDYGVESEVAGRAAATAIEAAIALCRTGTISGMVTAPINKAAFDLAKVPYPGHTEMLAELGGADEVAMMLANDEIRTVLVTIHVSLRDAIEQADFEAQMRAIRLAHQACVDVGIETPRIAVCGLNPHAGEGGLFGTEEIEIIMPAIEAAKDEGMDASGPWPGDTVFMQARQGRFDVVVAQYHDQGLIPVKYLGVENGVNVTLGLPFVRTSPDHGTAFDIAGQGLADPASMKLALDYARQLVAARQAKDA
ncbi:MAG: 4-hydroxythreonine-4-phosphate dehydrogenase PdxA [Pseudomonadota bacterium]